MIHPPVAPANRPVLSSGWATNSAMNAMSSVLVEDFYRPWAVRAGKQHAEKHFVVAGRVGMALMGIAMFVIAVLSYYWQRYANVPILDFVLGVMAFAYAGLLGVYFTALFTDRGSNRSVILALGAGFLVVLGLQLWGRVAFPWQLCAGTLVAFLVCVIEKKPNVQH